ncbi:L,D-transpeptidase family protein [Massilia sp. LjRoot122]|uniref:L,D-transpeptidase family protein n=1 Tax=Massilia sp. LjRoot122 TaxID=3342257 RepID=UPI003ECEF1CE
MQSSLPAKYGLAFLLFLAASMPAAAAPLDAGVLAARLYASGSPPRWLDDGQSQARLALQILGDAAAHGLDPRHYGADALARRLDGLRGDAGGFERDLSTAMLQFLSDLHAGRTRSPYRQAEAPAGLDLVEHLRSAVNGGSLPHAVDAAAPALPLYRRVKETLARYRELARLAPQWPVLPPAGPAGIVAGAPYAGAALLHQRLQLLGDLAPDAAIEDDGIYGSVLADAVRRFQSRHGLAEDGMLGAASIAALSVAPGRRAEQLALTMERLRWLPPLSGRTITVNVPAYRLWAFDPRERAAAQVLEMRVIVGKAAKTPTPLFIGTMRYLEFNPYWNVPRSIEVGEIVPKLVRNPAYLRQNDMELVSTGGQLLPAAGAETISLIRSGAVRVRQRPGAMNVLGEVKFAMPNPMNIYLHSTSAKELFSRARRDLSHGCIRVARPAELAQFVLADPVEWSAARVAAAMRPGPTRRVVLGEPVTVILFYATAVTDRQGRALFADDIYRSDPALLQRLRAD